MTLPPPDPARMAEEWAADQDVLRNLADNGDRGEAVRLIDVSFRGSDDALERLAEAAEALGFVVLEDEPSEEGEPYLFLGREQPADAESIRALTATCLGIEAAYDVEYDGWGCSAQTGLTH